MIIEYLIITGLLLSGFLFLCCGLGIYKILWQFSAFFVGCYGGFHLAQFLISSHHFSSILSLLVTFFLTLVCGYIAYEISNGIEVLLFFVIGICLGVLFVKVLESVTPDVFENIYINTPAPFIIKIVFTFLLFGLLAVMFRRIGVIIFSCLIGGSLLSLGVFKLGLNVDPLLIILIFALTGVIVQIWRYLTPYKSTYKSWHGKRVHPLAYRMLSIEDQKTAFLKRNKKTSRLPFIFTFENREELNSFVRFVKKNGGSIKDCFHPINTVAATVPASLRGELSKQEINSIHAQSEEFKIPMTTVPARLLLLLFRPFLSDSRKIIREYQGKKVSEKYNGKRVRIAVLDTGKPRHRNLKHRIKRAENYTSDKSIYDGNGHSTHVIGIIVARGKKLSGIAPGVEIIAQKVLSDSGKGPLLGIMRAVREAVEKYDADIISMSLGAKILDDGSHPLCRLLTYYSEKVTICVAQGNSGPQGQVGVPASAKGVIAVGSISKRKIPSWFSSIGPTADGRTRPHLTAPGESIWSTWLEGLYKALSGTSMATPHVAGCAACLFQAKPNLTPRKAREILCKSTESIQGGINKVGSGLVNLCKAFIYCGLPVESSTKIEKHSILHKSLVPAFSYFFAIAISQLIVFSSWFFLINHASRLQSESLAKDVIFLGRIERSSFEKFYIFDDGTAKVYLSCDTVHSSSMPKPGSIVLFKGSSVFNNNKDIFINDPFFLLH